VSEQNNIPRSPEQECRRIMYEVIDFLLKQLADRFSDTRKFEWVKLVHVDNFVTLSTIHREMYRLIGLFRELYPGLIHDTEKFKIKLTTMKVI
jgi:hypothetical protein